MQSITAKKAQRASLRFRVNCRKMLRTANGIAESEHSYSSAAAQQTLEQFQTLEAEKTESLDINWQAGEEAKTFPLRLCGLRNEANFELEDNSKSTRLCAPLFKEIN